jgi:hypothetical protein
MSHIFKLPSCDAVRTRSPDSILTQLTCNMEKSSKVRISQDQLCTNIMHLLRSHIQDQGVMIKYLALMAL